MDASILSRLTARGVDFEHMVSVTGDKLGWEDVAAGLAGLKDGPYLLTRLLWCEDATVMQKLHAVFLAEVTQLALILKWRCTNKLVRLCDLALEELMQSGHCSTCNGTGVSKVKICSRCSGSGKNKMFDAERALYLGVPKQKWRSRWEQKLYAVEMILCEWMSDSLRLLEYRLFEGKLTKGDDSGILNPRIENLTSNISFKSQTINAHRT
jgi:hypothetical protein